ncbi:hypothetical protein [Xanthomonas maliensis]|uniref:hypothetical protein n=1 Tax=Xanthomonas maliensis TaxID=1321368 RepID=UPI000399A828|nr:hypothetical protein [Xanthomonas maliensis]KAB7766788.1 hypothetical protein CKY51_12530 [Xanthomonas maliensis]
MRPTLLLALTLSSHALAQDVTIYRCTDAQGALTVQNMPCPKGVQQQKKQMSAPAAVPLPAPTLPSSPRTPSPSPAPTAATSTATTTATTTPTAGTTTASPPAATVDRPTSTLPPPPLFECTTHDNGRYLTEDSTPASRCMPLQMTDLSGGPSSTNGAACEVVTDRCAPVPDERLCEAWRQRAQQAESSWRFAEPAQTEERKQRYQHLRRVLDETRCAAPASTP